MNIKAYPTAEYGGCIWIYMGPPDKQPALPHLEWAMVPDSYRVVSRWLQERNYMQAVEGEIDSAHVSWLHAPLQVAHSPFRGRFNDAIITDGAPQHTVKPTDYGFCYGARRDAADGQYYWRVTQWLLPTFSLIPAKIFPRGGRAWIPIDDTHISVIQYSYHAARRRLITMARDLQNGSEPSAALRPETYNVRAVDMVCPEPDFWRFMELCAEAAVGIERGVERKKSEGARKGGMTDGELLGEGKG